MQLHLKPNRWSCALTSFAMALNVPSETLVSIIGHDGSEILFPELPEPMCRRGFHVQELILAALTLRTTVTPFERVPAIQSTPYPGVTPQVVPIASSQRDRMFSHLLQIGRGVITGLGNRCHHAVAFKRGHIYDPDGRSYLFSFPACEATGFYAQCVWLFQPLDN